MALSLPGIYDTRSGRVSSNVSAISWTGQPPVYSSGGIANGTAVTFDTTTGFANDIKPCSAAGQKAIGIAIDEPAVGPGLPCRYQNKGIARCLAGGVINPGDTVYVGDSSGRVTTAPSAATNYVLGHSVSPATVEAGDYVSVELNINDGKTTLP